MFFIFRISRFSYLWECSASLSSSPFNVISSYFRMILSVPVILHHSFENSYTHLLLFRIIVRDPSAGLNNPVHVASPDCAILYSISGSTVESESNEIDGNVLDFSKTKHL